MTDTATLLRQYRRLMNVRRSQTGAKAAVTQRKLEAVVQELHQAGVSDQDIQAAAE